MGYGRHTSKSGAHYEYFSCLSRVSKQGRCPASYAPVDAIEVEVAAEYLTQRLRLTRPERDLVRARVRDHAEAKAQTATRESERHARRLRELTDQQQKLIQLFYRELVSEEALQAEQERIKAERAQAHRWSEAATRDVTDVMQALDEALSLLDHRQIAYRDATHNQRRLLNQALFSHIFVVDPGTVECELDEFYARLIALARRLAQRRDEAAEGPETGRGDPNDPDRRQENPEPIFSGRVRTSIKWRRGRDSNPRTRFPPLRDFQSRPFNRSGTSPGVRRSKATRSDNLATPDTARGFTTRRATARKRSRPVLAMGPALSKTLGLIATFGGIGVLVNAIILFIMVQAKGEKQQNEDYTAGLRQKFED
jgi:hypothetical protein